MIDTTKNKIISIYGPTISKKTGLALNLGKYIWGAYSKDITFINADSRKMYIEMKTSQVKFDPPFDKKFKVELTNFLKLDKQLELAEYQKLCFAKIDNAFAENKLPILFGGTGLYHLSVLQNWILEEGVSQNLGRGEPKYEYITLVPNMYREELYAAIKKHAAKQIKDGIFNETKILAENYKITPFKYKNDKRWNILKQTIGHAEFFEHAYRNSKPFDKFTKKDMMMVEKAIAKNLVEMARKQIRHYKAFDNLYFVDDWNQARGIVDQFLSDKK